MKNYSLKRVVSLPYLVFYGLGNIIGAGIYVLIGKIAGISGYWTPLSFFVASFAVLFTALCYAELTARYPVSSAEARYMLEAFDSKFLAHLVSSLILLSGIFSTAAIISGFYGYIRSFVDLGFEITTLLLLLSLTLVAIWGIKESVTFTAIFTLIEIGGLSLIIIFGAPKIESIPLKELAPPLDLQSWHFILMGSFLAFYAFIGFEDMVKITEEVKEARATMPKAILLTVALATFFYILVSLISILLVEPATLAMSEAPLALVFKRAGQDPAILSFIALFAIVNGALVQLIMVSRLLYGMGKEGLIPKWFMSVHPRTRTPINATLVSTLLVGLSTLFIDLVSLASLTSLGILLVFTLVAASLIVIKRKEKEAPFEVAPWIPYAAIAINLILLFSSLFKFGT